MGTFLAHRYSGGFGRDNGYRVDFGTSFGATISDGMFTVNVDSSTTQGIYVPGQNPLALGDPYDGLFYIVTYGCQLN